MGMYGKTNRTRLKMASFDVFRRINIQKNAPAGASSPLIFLFYNIQSLITL